MSSHKPPDLPLVYSCSGCSNVAQGANQIAVRLDREGLAEMSCIAGVAAGVPSLVRIAQSGRPMLVIDGCPLACCRRALAIQGVEPTIYMDLSRQGLKKRPHEDLDSRQIDTLWNDSVLPAIEELRDPKP